MKKMSIVLVIVLVLFFITPTFAYDPRPESERASVGLMVVDVLLVRPPCVALSTLSTGVFLAISPFVYVLGVGNSVAKTMVELPWRFTAVRYPGEFNHYTDEQPAVSIGNP